MLGFIAFLSGFATACIIIFKSDDWRVGRLKDIGYDAAVRDITQYGYYYNKDNVRIPIKVL